MTELNTGPLGPAKVPPRNNVYTVLMAVAALSLLIGIAFVLFRDFQLNRSILSVDQASASSTR